MQAEIDSAHTSKRIRILGVNAVGQDADNAVMTSGRVLPWLQDVAAKDVWGAWKVTWRDVVVLGTDNVKLSVYNLTDHDLNNPENYAALKKSLLDAAK